MDDEHVQYMAGDFLHLDRVDLADPVGRIDHEVTGPKTKLLRHLHLSNCCRSQCTGTHHPSHPAPAHEMPQLQELVAGRTVTPCTESRPPGKDALASIRFL